MSGFDRFEWLNAWVDDPEVNDDLMSVLVVMMRHMDRSGICYPTRRQVAHKIGRSVRTVQRRMKKIRRLEYLKTPDDHTTTSKNQASLPTASHDTSGTTPRHQCHPDTSVTPTPVALPPDTSVVTEQLNSDTSGTTPRHQCPTPPTPVSPKQTIKQTIKQPSTSKTRENANSGHAEKPAPKSTPFSHPNTDRPISADDVLTLQPDQMIRSLADGLDLPVAPGTEVAIWREAHRKIKNVCETRHYLRWKMSDLASAEGDAKKKLTGRAVMRALRADAGDWVDRDKPRSRGKPVRAGIHQDAGRIREFVKAAEERSSTMTPEELMPDVAEFDDDEVPF